MVETHLYTVSTYMMCINTCVRIWLPTLVLRSVYNYIIVHACVYNTHAGQQEQ